MQSEVNDLLAASKIMVDAQVKIINKNQTLFEKVATNHKFLFSDLDLFINNEGELFEFKVKDRIAKYELEQKDIQAKKSAAENVAVQEPVVQAINPVLQPTAEVLRDEVVMHVIPDLIEIVRCVANGFKVTEQKALSWINTYANYK